MQWILVGLGNPGSEYIGTRHNIGRDFLMAIEKKLPSKTKVVFPDVYMNHSGTLVKKSVGEKMSAKALERLVVLHDDLDLPIGKVKISFGSSSGGHRGVDSIQKALKTKNFVRIRIGISPATPGGKLKKPSADDTVDFVLGKFKAAEKEKLKKVQTLVTEALELLIADGRDHATMVIHSKN